MRLKATVGSLLFLALTVAPLCPSRASDIELGKVDQYKLKSYADYFGRYYSDPDPIFEEPEFGIKLKQEAGEIYTWLQNKSNWPPVPKVSPELKWNRARLLLYFANAGIRSAAGEVAPAFREAAQSDASKSEEALFFVLAWLHRAGESKEDEYAVEVSRALTRFRKRALKEGLGIWLAQRSYEEGKFAKAYHWLQAQLHANPENEEAENLKFVLEALKSKWGYLPQKVRYIHDETGARVPIPVQ